MKTGPEMMAESGIATASGRGRARVLREFGNGIGVGVPRSGYFQVRPLVSTRGRVRIRQRAHEMRYTFAPASRRHPVPLRIGGTPRRGPILPDGGEDGGNRAR